MTTLLVVAAIVAAIPLTVWAAHRMLVASAGDRSSSSGNALMGFMEVFEPARARAQEDLKNQTLRGPSTPSPDGDRPIRLGTGADGRTRSMVIKTPPRS